MNLKKSVFWVISGCLLVFTACEAPDANTERSAKIEESSITELPLDASPLEAPPTEEPPPPPEPELAHEMIPGDLPPDRTNQATDHDSSTTADQKRAPGGDRLAIGMLERPFSPDPMDIYFPELDIQSAQLYLDETWIYVRIILKGADETGKLSGNYALELDTDRDGRGDWLVLARAPLYTGWTTDGVQVWHDNNNSIGAQSASWADNNPIDPNDGFEELIFENGEREDPNAAWMRTAPTEANTVDIAFKVSICNAKRFLWNVWAGHDLLDPAIFDHNDQFSNEEAGSPLIAHARYYPLKGLHEIDNICFMPAGYNALGNEPGLCRP